MSLRHEPLMLLATAMSVKVVISMIDISTSIIFHFYFRITNLINKIQRRKVRTLGKQKSLRTPPTHHLLRWRRWRRGERRGKRRGGRRGKRRAGEKMNLCWNGLTDS